ncbi:MAG: hypothetical protein MUP41_09620 [Desulfobacterales bacterium]|nr:hypothetical protein [Desulfobacterales bacterium]
MITPHGISDFDKMVKKMVFDSEGKNITVPTNIDDHTVTYGYGYTFIRKNSQDVWSLYGDLDHDLLKIGITLTEDMSC